MPVDLRSFANRTFREFRRFFGDGLTPPAPSGATLPIGDPQSGRHKPPKPEIREMFGAIEDEINEGINQASQSATVAQGAAAAAEAARDLAEDYASTAAAQAEVPIFASRAVAAALSDLPAGLNAVRVNGFASEGDGGDGLDLVSATEPTTAPKSFNPNINRWFTGSETVMDIMRFGARRLGSGTSGVISANDAALADAKEWLHGRLVGGALPELRFGPGVYDYSVFPNFAKNRARIVGLGDCRLRFHGSGRALVLDGDAETSAERISDGVWAMAFLGFIVEAPASAAADVVLLRALQESQFKIEVRGGATGDGNAGLRLEWLVSSYIHYRCSANGFGGWYDNARPNIALWIDDHDPPLDFNDDGNPDQTDVSFCHIDAYTVGSDYGVWMEKSNGNMVRGTFQGHPVIGALLNAGAQDNVFWNSDWEVNDVDVIMNGAKGNTLRDSVTLKQIILDAGAEGNRISGGVHASIVLGETAIGNTIETKTLTRIGPSAITDLGQQNSIHRSWDGVLNRFWRRTPTVLSITPAGTVYTWTNPHGDPMALALTLGTIEGISLGGVDLAPTSRLLTVPPGVTVQWDASVAPNATVYGI